MMCMGKFLLAKNNQAVDRLPSARVGLMAVLTQRERGAAVRHIGSVAESELFAHIHPAQAILDTMMGFYIASASVDRNILGHGFIGVEDDVRIARVNRLLLGKLHQLPPEPEALGIRVDGEVIQQERITCSGQDDNALNPSAIVQHMHTAAGNPLVIVLQHRTGFTTDALYVRRIGDLDNEFNGSDIVGGSGAYHGCGLRRKMTGM
ncbi:hypothetical protein TU79_16460 [Pseudomonas trivialis]|uniref:Uncharacterized protein n=1 Tax=Pseudomonas trivialis TaxID=200450 RepID=A0A0R2ZKL3_9PSED|nr:hypothetical protein TU79_16460 [Pseudomonas trivialis]